MGLISESFICLAIVLDLRGNINLITRQDMARSHLKTPDQDTSDVKQWRAVIDDYC